MFSLLHRYDENHLPWRDCPPCAVCLSCHAVEVVHDLEFTCCFVTIRYVGTAAGVAAKQLVDGSVSTVQDVSVAEVQNILTSRFDQIVHLPPPPAPPGPSPRYYNVSGAGAARWNGKYIRTASGMDIDQSPLYKSTSKSCADCSLYSNGGTWRLAVEGKELFYVASQESTLPPLPASDWTVAEGGVAPSPTLVAGPL